MKPVLIFRHIECEGPGYLDTVLSRFGIPSRLIAVDRGEAIPRTVDHASALVFMGGPMSVNDDQPWIKRELALIRTAIEHDMPVLGHCLGGQLIAKALGATVTRNPVKEIGWLPVSKLDRAADDTWLGDVPSTFTAFHWHGETFSIPKGAKPLLRSEHCTHQAFALGRTLALQFHLEVTAPMVEQWSELYADELTAVSPTVQSRAEMLSDLDSRVQTLQHVGDTLYTRWLRGVAA